MATGKVGIVGAFMLGFGIGVSAQKWWPVLSEKMGPLTKDLLGKGLDAADKAKDLFWEKSEKFADVISELKEEAETRAKKPKGTGPEPIDN